MKYGSCRSLMKNSFHEGFDESIVATILKETLKALGYMHQNKFIHKYKLINQVIFEQITS